ncbi:hypothetical protein ABIB25_001160 [Nakamurella sp. UYEF19]|uniref:hypothetical protein n=1 Tax=Nakamurella sp. UYEF19 TaxID=1756392 RepID=UPI0033986390
MNILIRTFAHGLATATMVGVLALASACGSTGGIATTAPSTTSDLPTSGGTSTRTSIPSGSTVTDGPISTTPISTDAGPPTCQETPNKLTTPTREPMITVTQGANSWIANRATEPLALAVYLDGSGLASQGIGEATKPLAEMRLGYVPSCVLVWAKSELQQLAILDMGDPTITDQGTTTVTYQPEGRPPLTISAYALGIGDQYVTSGKENRARLTALIAALSKPFANAAPWTPTRLKIVAVTPTVASEGAALVWPGKVSLQEVLVRTLGSNRCGEVNGDDAVAVLETLGQRNVYSRWTDAGTVFGLSIGALVPGQPACTAD